MDSACYQKHEHTMTAWLVVDVYFHKEGSYAMRREWLLPPLWALLAYSCNPTFY